MNSELNFDGKKYISARRASEISGYNSDYIGQLCRKGDLDCRRIGRAWFVEEISLKSHQDEASKKTRGRIEIYEAPKVEKEHTQLVVEKAPETEPEPVAVTSVEVWSALENLSPKDYVNEVQDRKESHRFALKVASVLTLMLLFVFSFSTITSLRIPNKHRNLSQVISQSLISPVIALFENPTTKENKIILAANVFSGGSEMMKETVSLIPEKIHTVQIRTHQLTLRMYHGLSLATNFATDRMKKFASLSSGEKKVEQKKARDGIVVVPSTNNDAKDEQVKQYIKDSFSDETNVMPDGSGKSGAITPVFRKESEDKYLYVIVPVVDH